MLEIFIVAALYYLVMTTVWGFIQERLETHFSRSVVPYGGRRDGEVRAARLKQKMDAEVLSHDAQ